MKRSCLHYLRPSRRLSAFVFLVSLSLVGFSVLGQNGPAQSEKTPLPVQTRNGFCVTPPASHFVASGKITAEAVLPPADTLPDPTALDLLLLYTTQAAQGAGGEDIIRQQILNNIADGNRRFSNSLINVHLNPVYIGPIDYAETGDMNLDGDRLVSGSNGFGKAHTLRDAYKADITILITELENHGAGGGSWSIPPPSGGEAELEFSVVRRLYLRFPMIMVHELGHLLGCDHSRDNSSFPLSDPFYKARFPYIFGHRLMIESVGYADTMTYPPAVHLPLFANPNISIDGVPTGAAAPDPEPSDTARTINQIAPYVAKYRQALSRIEFATNFVEAGVGETIAAFHLKRSGDVRNSTRVTVSFGTNSTAESGMDYVKPSTLNVTFAPAQDTADFNITLLPNAARTNSRTLILNLTAPQGNHGIGWTGSSTLVLDGSAQEAVIPPQGPQTLAAAGILDNPGKDLHPNAGLNVMNRGDGKLLVWGHFSRIAGRDQSGLALLNQDGTLDESFRPPQILIGHRALPGLLNPFINAVQPLPDGSIVIGGLFSRIDGEPRLNLAKLRADGSLDRSFNSALSFDGPVFSISLQSDGKLLVSGFFKNVSGEPFPALVRLNEDGQVDHDFKPEITQSKNHPGVNTVFALRDGHVLIGGAFDRVDDQISTNIARLNPDGSLDKAFLIGIGASSAVSRFAIQPDGRVLVAGRFLSFNRHSSPRLARLNSDGSYDPTFRSPAPNEEVKDIIALPDGRILISGFFTKVGSASARFMALLKSDGALDAAHTFGSGPDDLLGNEVTYAFGDEMTGHPLAVAADGSLFAAGVFHAFNGIAAPNLVRLGIGPCPPAISYSTRADGGLDLLIDGLSGGHYTIESTENLTNWKSAGETSFRWFATHAIFPVPAGSPSNARFFRLKAAD